MDEEGPFYKCCQHCEGPDGELTCSPHDSHTVECNEPLCFTGQERVR